MSAEPLRVAIAGCGLIGGKRAAALGPDRLVGCYDAEPTRAVALAAEHGAEPRPSLEALLADEPDVVVVATTHDALTDGACAVLRAGAHVLVEKPGARNAAELERLREAAAARPELVVAVGFNHRFHLGIRDVLAHASSGEHGDVMFLRARYGHGGRLGYETEWRAQPERSGGGELIDQGMHLIDLCRLLVGELPLQSALVRTSYWPMAVDDNAVIVLAGDGTRAPWATFHVSCSEWKNLFDLEVYCRTAKLHLSGLAGSYGRQVLRVYRMRPELGPPDVEQTEYPSGDPSWDAEWLDVRGRILGEDGTGGDLAACAYALDVIGEAYRRSGYGEIVTPPSDPA